MDKAALGYCGPSAEAGQGHQGGKGGAYQAAIIGVRQVVDGDAGGAWGYLDVGGVGQAATNHQFADLVGVTRGVVALVPPLIGDIGRGEPVLRQGMYAEAPVVFNGPRAEILGQLEDAVEGGAVLLLLAEECVC